MILILVFLILPISTLFSEALQKHLYGIYPSDYKQVWVFYEREHRGFQTQIIFRPFYSTYYDKRISHTHTTSFYPLYYSQSTNYWSKWSFLFFFGNESTRHEDLGDDRDYVLTPIFQWGRGSTEKDEYFSIFPFFGKWKSKLSWSEINFFLFPLYIDWSHKEFEAKSILWPFTLYGKSDVRREYRFLPFFSHKSHTGKFEHNSFLWPFISWGRDNLDKKEPSSYAFVWFVYAYKKSYYENMKSFSFMPILGTWSLFSYGYDKRSAEKDFTFLFFLFQYGYSNDKDFRKLIVFPFYGYSYYANKELKFITPFYITMRADTYHEKTNFYYLVPFFIYSNRFFPKEEREDFYIKIWPFYRFHKDTEGNLEWNTFSLFPIRSTTFEKIWDPLWSIIEYKKLINGEKRLSLFMRIYTQRWSENEFHFYVPFLLDYSSVNGKRNIDFLYGFLGFEKNQNSFKFKLFWFIEI
ncbi:MAG: hypothetical protein N3A69_02515 [Leptospiraceae bacterium]|nr:hypothetical protein [Leptospiraceae bacterium]